MGNHAKAFGIKLIIVSTVIFSVFGIFHNGSFAKLLAMTLILAGLSYGIGDLVIFPKLGHLYTALIDTVTFFSLTWILSFILIGGDLLPLTLASLATMYFLAIAEPLFHAYIEERVTRLGGKQQVQYAPIREGQLQTEISEELHPEIKRTIRSDRLDRINFPRAKENNDEQNGEQKS